MPVKATVDSMRSVWIPLGQGAAWISAVLGTFLLPPPDILVHGEIVSQPWPNFARFVLAFLCGIAFVVSRWSGTRNNWKTWSVASLILLSLGSGLLFFYWYRLSTSACQYRGMYVMAGRSYVNGDVATAARSFGTNCTALIESVGGDTTGIWPMAELVVGQATLAVVFVLAACLLAGSIMCLLEGIRRSPEGVPTAHAGPVGRR
jgi:hypothetical protein